MKAAEVLRLVWVRRLELDRDRRVLARCHDLDDLRLTARRRLPYMPRDRKLGHALIDRAASAGFRALEVSVDTPVGGHRTRDLRAGLTISPSLGARAILDIGAHPGYWTTMLRSPALEFASLPPPDPIAGVTIADISALFDPSLNWDVLAEIRARWAGPLLVKGPLGPADAARAVAAGADGIHLSNHGGRQLDRCIPRSTWSGRRARPSAAMWSSSSTRASGTAPTSSLASPAAPMRA